MLPTDDKERKSIPVYAGCFSYFPDALSEVAAHSQASNEQHNPGQPLHWDKSKSTDQLGSLARHLLDTTAPHQSLDDQILHARAMAWRSLAHLQGLCELRNENPQKIAQPLLDTRRIDIDGRTVHAYMRELRLKDDG